MHLPLSVRDPRTAISHTWSALRHVEWADPANPPAVLAYTTVARANPFQEVLYGGLAEQGIVPAATNTLPTTADLVSSLGSEVATGVHLHWLNVVLNQAESEFDARQRLEEFIQQLERVKSLGTRVMWTVHNVLPHDTKWEELDVELRQRVIELADVVHVMSPRTVELCAPYFSIPAEKLYACPHPGYQGVYPDYISQAEARQLLGLPPGTLVLALLGAIKPYKGLIELCDAVTEASAREPGGFAVVVAGRPDRSEETQRFLDAAAVHPSVHVHAGRVPVDAVQVFMRAADLCAMPYRASLNSGAFALAQAFDLPVLVTSTSGTAALVDDSFAEVYDPTDPGALTDALLRCRRLADPAARQAAAKAAEDTLRPTVAGWFAQDVRSWLNSGQVPASRGTVGATPSKLGVTS